MSFESRCWFIQKEIEELRCHGTGRILRYGCKLDILLASILFQIKIKRTRWHYNEERQPYGLPHTEYLSHKFKPHSNSKLNVWGNHL